MITDKPKIIETDYNYYKEPSILNSPKMILVIDNKSINRDEMIRADIDYKNTNPNSINNIMNLFNRTHSDLITTEMENNVNSFSDKGYFTVNNNFAYHYFIDKEGNIYKGRDKEIPAFNLDVYDYNAKNNTYELIPPTDTIFRNFLVILTEENANDLPINDKCLNSLAQLIKYLMKYDDALKEFYCFNEIKTFNLEIGNSKEECNLKYNNPGLFFPVNLLRCSVNGSLIPIKNETYFKQTIYTYGSRTLEYSKVNTPMGNDVIELQWLLYNNNIITDFSKINGIYDMDTKKAVEIYQRNQYLKNNIKYGIADPFTLNHILNNKTYRNRLNNDLREEFFYSANLSPEFNRILTYTDNNESLMMGEDVKYIQSLLKEKISVLQNVNGFYDKDTMENIVLFQKLIKLESPDGKCSPYIKNALETVTTFKALQEDLTPEYGNEHTTYSYSVALLQKALINVGGKNKITGIYDKQTINSISILNSDKEMRELMGINNIIRNDSIIDWNDSKNLSICFIEEFDYLIKHNLKL